MYIDGVGKVVLLGFISTHNHTFYNFMVIRRVHSVRWHANTSEWKHMNHMEDLSVELAHLHGTAEERWNEERSCPLCSILSIRFE